MKEIRFKIRETEDYLKDLGAPMPSQPADKM
jgi:hypothetical protein